MIESLELSDLPVVAVTADGASHNWHFFHLCCLKEDGKKSPIPYVSSNLFADIDVHFFCDKNYKKLLQQFICSQDVSGAEGTYTIILQHSTLHTNLIQKKGSFISWKHIEALYLLEADTKTPGVRLCHKLKRDHVWLTSYSKMKANLTAQVRKMKRYNHASPSRCLVHLPLAMFYIQ